MDKIRNSVLNHTIFVFFAGTKAALSQKKSGRKVFDAWLPENKNLQFAE
jgi:hypothetical protein